MSRWLPTPVKRARQRVPTRIRVLVQSDTESAPRLRVLVHRDKGVPTRQWVLVQRVNGGPPCGYQYGCWYNATRFHAAAGARTTRQRRCQHGYRCWYNATTRGALRLPVQVLVQRDNRGPYGCRCWYRATTGVLTRLRVLVPRGNASAMGLRLLVPVPVQRDNGAAMRLRVMEQLKWGAIRLRVLVQRVNGGADKATGAGTSRQRWCQHGYGCGYTRQRRAMRLRVRYYATAGGPCGCEAVSTRYEGAYTDVPRRFQRDASAPRYC